MVTLCRTSRHASEVALLVKDDRVRDERVLVYSSDGSLPLPTPPARRKTQPVLRAMPDDGVLRVAREKRRASVVTVVHGLPAGEVDAVGKELKRLCGTGGTAKNGVVELQGDHRDKIVAYFEERGRRIKRAGG
jgi:translation initiation factor 1